MREYSPKRRTALVLAGSGTSGAYHAGVLKALDESGIKIDLLVGSGVGTVAAAYGAVAGGARLYGDDGFWPGLGWESVFRLRTGVRLAVLLLACSFGAFLLPVVAAMLLGVFFLPVALIDVVLPGVTSRAMGMLAALPVLVRGPYLAALSVPIFILCVVALLAGIRILLRERRRAGELFESVLDSGEGRGRLAGGLWEISRGSTVSKSAPSAAELGRRYVALLGENLGQPGFRELILLDADLDAAGPLPFVVLADGPRAAFAAARARGPRSRLEGIPGAVDLRGPGYDTLLFDAVAAGLLPPGVAAPIRVAFPKGGIFAGESHRLADGTLAGRIGISEAVAAGAEQIIVATAVPEAAAPLPRRRGPRALADGVLSTLERQAVEGDLRAAERITRMVETLGHRTEDGGRAWQDPATGRQYRDVSLYVVRPERRVLAPLDLDGSEDASTEVRETVEDLMEQGYRDAYRLFVEPVVGAVPEPKKAPPPAAWDHEGQPVEL
jgi:predicted acylesterase/phospholipase RssA